MTPIDFEVNWSMVKITVTFSNVALGVQLLPCPDDDSCLTGFANFDTDINDGM